MLATIFNGGTASRAQVSTIPTNTAGVSVNSIDPGAGAGPTGAVIGNGQELDHVNADYFKGWPDDPTIYKKGGILYGKSTRNKYRLGNKFDF